MGKVLLWLLAVVMPGRMVVAEVVPTHPVRFFDENTFYAGVEWAKKHSTVVGYHVRGGIVPHHLFPGFILADFFQRLAVQQTSTIIFIGPNHYEKGKFKLLSSEYGWETPFGVVSPDKQMIRELVKAEVMKIDEETVAGDHSVAGMMPFVSYYLPDTTVVPILVSRHTTENEIERLAEALKGYMNQEVVLVAPVDFSHYLVNKQAQTKDEVTLQAIKSFDYRQLFAMNNDYLDSPQSIATLLMLMQKLGSANMEVLQHANSGELQHDENISTTSYFSMVYH